MVHYDELVEFFFEDHELVNTTNSYTKSSSSIPTLVVDGEVCLIPTFSLAKLGEMVYVVSSKDTEHELIAKPTLAHLQEHINACIRCEMDEGKTSCVVAICRIKSDPWRVGVVAGQTIRKPTEDEFEKLRKKVK